MSKKATRTKIAAVEHYVAQSRGDVEAAIREIGLMQRSRQRIEADMNDALSERRAHYEAQAKPIAERIVELTRGVALWCEANRQQLTNDGKIKTHRFASGEVSWRLRPPSIVVRGADQVLGMLERLGLVRFIRTKQELDREALLSEPDIAKTLPGVAVSQREDFIVKPDDTALEEVQTA